MVRAARSCAIFSTADLTRLSPSEVVALFIDAIFMKQDRYIYGLYSGDQPMPCYIGVGKGKRINDHMSAARNGRSIGNERKHRTLVACYPASLRHPDAHRVILSGEMRLQADKPNRSGHAGQTHGKARQIQVARHFLGPSTAPTSTPRRTGRHPPHIIVGERFNSVGPRAPPDRQLERPPARHPAPAHPRRHHPRHRGRGPVSWWRLRRGGGLRICAREVAAREDVGDLQLFSRRPGGCALPIARSATHRTATFPAQMAFRPVECSLDVNGSLV
jgi:hypothetical protein